MDPVGTTKWVTWLIECDVTSLGGSVDALRKQMPPLLLLLVELFDPFKGVSVDIGDYTTKVFFLFQCLCQHYLYSLLYYSTNTPSGLYHKSYNWTNQFTAFAKELWWLSEYLSRIVNDVDILFQNGRLCWHNAIRVNGLN